MPSIIDRSESWSLGLTIRCGVCQDRLPHSRECRLSATSGPSIAASKFPDSGRCESNLSISIPLDTCDSLRTHILKTYRYIAVVILLISAFSVLLSYLAKIPYMYTVCGIAAWSAVGHLITLDDDAPRGWSNPGKSDKFWHRSLRDVALKFIVLFALLAIIFAIPGLDKWGA